MIFWAVVVSLVSVAGSFLCSVCEAALYTVSDSRAAAMAQARVLGARRLVKLKSDIDMAVAAILTLNTITHTVGAAVAGALVAKAAGSIWVGVFSAVFTVLILFASEIIPKSYGIARADTLAPRLAWVVQWMIWSLWPLAWLCAKMTRWLNRNRPRSAPTELEILSMARLAASEGELPAHEAQLVTNALKLDQITVHDLMTPRSVVYALPDAMPLMNAEKQSEHWVHSRLPVLRDDNPEEVVGIVHRRDVFDLIASELEGEKTIADVMRPVRFVRADSKADQALQQFLSGRQHMFIVLDKYGSWVGLITLEDVLEALLGQEIVGEHDLVTDMQALARRRAAERGIAANPRKQPGAAPTQPPAEDKPRGKIGPERRMEAG